MQYAIVDCYTDEPSGLGVPPYLGTYPRYLYGALENGKNKIFYLTIDDLRHAFKDFKQTRKTNIKTYNLTKNADNVQNILNKVDEIIVIAGINTPGKYLSAIPGSINEVANFIKPFRANKVLTGPAALIGTRMQGGRTQEKLPTNIFNILDYNYLNINDYKNIKPSAEILKQIPYPVMIELELSKGCDIGKCSFCTEPLKSCGEYRQPNDIIKEATELVKNGTKYFRLGKATCFYSYQNGDIKQIKQLLKGISNLKPKVFHIDNVNPNKVIFGDGDKITKLIVEHCTEGNTAAFGVESFDIEVVKANKLNTKPENAIKTIKIINKYGKERGPNGMPKFLPGLNLILGLLSENKKSLEINYQILKQILDEQLMLRRINIRQVVPFDGTYLKENGGLKYLLKNKKYYWSWRKKVRREIDFEFLKRLLPKETILKNVYMEIHDGNTTFGRQFGTYPIIVGVKKKLELKKFYDIKVTDWMLRSVVGEIL